MVTIDTELYHYGVPGMKWGVRKDRRSQDRGGGNKKVKTKTLTATQKVSADRRAAVAKDRLKTMSDEELSSRISRLQQEKKLKDLTFESEATKGERAKKAAARTVKSAAGKVGKVLVTAAAGAASVAALAYIDQKVTSDAIKSAYKKGAGFEELAKQFAMDKTLVERVVNNTDGVIMDPARKVAMIKDLISFGKAAMKKGK